MLTEKLDIETPIIQAPMAGVSTPELAAAVSNAGALGSLGLGAMTVDAARLAIRETRSRTSRPFLVNFFCHTESAPDPDRDSAWLSFLEPSFAEFHAAAPSSLTAIYPTYTRDDAIHAMLLEERPPVVSFHFGLPPAPQIAALRQAGIIVIASATNLTEARLIENAGLDAVIAQGFEAGGHRSVFDPQAVDDQLGTFALTRLLARKTNLPVIAAGGIMDGAGIAAVLTLGAEAAQLGTAFVACPESAANVVYREALLSHKAYRTVMTLAISGRPARGLANRLTALAEDPGAPPVPRYPYAYDAAKALHAAATATGNSDFAAHWAGQGAPFARSMPAADLVTTLREELALAHNRQRELAS
jgi:nitronate monooxygenase